MPVEKYGHIWESEAFRDERNIELYAFKEWYGTELGFLGRLGHFKKMAKLFTPAIEWNPWTEMRARAFCSPENWHVQGNQRFLNVANMGCASSGKTHDWTWFAVLWWIADPMNSAVILCSIQKQMIRERCWAVVQEVFNSNDVFRHIGHMVDSKTFWMADRGDNKHAIRAQAVESGEVNKAKQAIAGIHCKRIMLIIDEAPGTPEAIFEIIPNLLAGCNEFVLVTNGNAIGRLTPHGRICEPTDGWSSVTEESVIYDTVAVPEWGIKPGICIHYHGKHSPNVKAGKTVYPYIYTWENWKDAERKVHTPNYWIYDAGWFAPDGMLATVLEESAVVKMGGMGDYTWESWSRPVAAFDPAFGTGDDPAFYFGEIGDIAPGRTGLCVREKVPIKIQDIRDKPAEFQMAEQIMAECAKRGVKPIDFGLDATGIGRGIAAVLTERWSPDIVKVEFGGSPSDVPVSQDDPRSCKDVYDRRVTELWFRVREMLLAGQLRGLPRDAVKQFCQRTYDLDTKKIRLEKKTEYKQRFGRSPDDADAVAVMCEVAAQRGMVVASSAMAAAGPNRWIKEAKKYDEVFYTDDEVQEEYSWFAEDD